MSRSLSLLLIVPLVILCGFHSTARAAVAVRATDVSTRFVLPGSQIDRFRAIEVGGVVVLRGRTSDREAALSAGRIAQALGFLRVANLIEVIEAPDDIRIQRVAERELATDRSLQGCRFTVASHAGYVQLRGSVYSELQKEMAVALLQNIDGVRGVTSDLR